MLSPSAKFPMPIILQNSESNYATFCARLDYSNPPQNNKVHRNPGTEALIHVETPHWEIRVKS